MNNTLIIKSDFILVGVYHDYSRHHRDNQATSKHTTKLPPLPRDIEEFHSSELIQMQPEAQTWSQMKRFPKSI